jgi:catechol 2,3-dioxygenase-like lactoylglutathione lyase family enzyme
VRSVMLLVGGIGIGLVIGAESTVSQAQGAQPNVRLNHVAISVPNITEALTWYRNTMGFREVIRNTNAAGELQSAYIQVSRDTFVELQQSNPQRPVGLNHWGLEVADMAAAVSTFRQRGATVSDPADKPSAFSGGFLANVTDPHSGGRIELSFQPADGGKLRKATEEWK